MSPEAAHNPKSQVQILPPQPKTVGPHRHLACGACALSGSGSDPEGADLQAVPSARVRHREVSAVYVDSSVLEPCACSTVADHGLTKLRALEVLLLGRRDVRLRWPGQAQEGHGDRPDRPSL